MSNAVFTTSASSIYDDQPEIRYHFPSKYLRAVEQTVGDWIVYYEPRRTTGLMSSTGRSAYFAIARVTGIAPDGSRPDHYYAHVSDYLEFDSPVPFRIGIRYFEPALKKEDGSTNKGAFGWAARALSRSEFDSIIAQGFTRELSAWELADRVSESVPDVVERPTVTQVVSRKFRDAAFRRHVREVYSNTCAVTGLRLTNGGGRPEVQAAHFRPVEFDGPDTVRNGLALTATVHWMFDRGLISVDESFRVLVSNKGIPAELSSLVQPGKPVWVPKGFDVRPHPTYLRWHREQRFEA